VSRKPTFKVRRKSPAPVDRPIDAGNLRIVSDGTPAGTRVEYWNGVAFERLDYVVAVEWTATSEGCHGTIRMAKVPVNLIARSYTESVSDADTPTRRRGTQRQAHAAPDSVRHEDEDGP
jgi:hypothetical protein